MVERTVEVTNEKGLNGRPAALFVQSAGKFTSHVWITKDNRKINAKSIMGLMSLSISRGSEITICAEGEDESQVIRELTELISSMSEK